MMCVIGVNGPDKQTTHQFVTRSSQIKATKYESEKYIKCHISLS